MSFINQWVFSLVANGVKLKNNNTGDIYVLAKDFIMLQALDSDKFTIYEEATQITLTLKRSECLTPAPNSTIELFLDSLTALISI